MAEDPGPTSLSIDYPAGFYREQGPVHLDYVCAVNGADGPGLPDGFTYCELGCGAGLTTTILAASNPGGSFVGIDLSPSQIERADALAKEAGLTNLRFIEADICDLDASSLPEFDFITLHGLYAWVPSVTRQAIRGFIASLLKRGGLAYVSYNALPGWAAVAPLRHYFVKTAARIEGDALTKAQQVLDRLEELRAMGAPIFAQSSIARTILERLRKADIAYVVHEFLGPSWTPMHFSEVSEEMAEAGLVYIGAGQIAENFVDFSVHEEMRDTIRAIHDRDAREAEQDFATNRLFRGDVYMRAGSVEPSARSGDPLDRVLYGMTSTPVECPGEIDIPGGKLALTGEPLDALKSVLAERVLTIGELADAPPFRGLSRAALVDAATRLVVGGCLAPFARRTSGPGCEAALRLNAALIAGFSRHQRGLVLASPVAGTGVGLSAIEVVLLRAHLANTPPGEVHAELTERGLRLALEDRPLEPGDQANAEIGRLLARFASGKLPKLIQLGMCERRPR